MPKIAIVGNCQASALEAIFLMYTKWQVVRVPAVYSLTENCKTEIYEKLSSADIIFAQRVTDDYQIEYVRTSVLRKTFKQVISWPNIYFSGYFPDIQYIYQPNIGKLVGPLGDYHMRLVHYFYGLGKAVDECVALYCSEVLNDYYPNPIEASLEELARRECDVDLPVSIFLRGLIYRSKCFFTVNHPSNLILFELAVRMMGTQGDSFQLPRLHPYSLSAINIPIYPEVRRKNQLEHLPESSIVGIGRHSLSVKLEEAPAKVYENWTELISHFYRLYDEVFGYKKAG